MGFLSFLGFTKMVEEGAKVLEFPKPKAVPPVPQVATPKPPQPKEHYRVGYVNETGMTTLTIMSHDGWGSITLSMNKQACEAMIRLLRATYEDESPSNPTDDPDGGLPIEESEAKVA